MENKFCLKSKKELDEIREAKKQLVGPAQKEAKFKVGDKVKVNGKNGTIKTITSMKLSATPTYKIELEDGTVVYRYEEEIAESKIDEISDETVYNAVAKAHNNAKEAIANDKDIDKNLKKLNRLDNAGIRRALRKAGLKNPADMSDKQLKKVWDKDYVPIYQAFTKNVHDRLVKKQVDEISDELKNKVTARRRADFNKANAEYDRASAKEGVAYGAPETDKALDKSYRANVKLQKNLRLRATDWREKLDGDEFVTLKDGREGTLGGVVYDKDNNFVGYEFSTNPYGGYEYEKIKPEDIASLAESKINENGNHKIYPIHSDKTNFVNSVIIDKNSKGYLQACLINDEIDACVGYIVFSNNLEDYRKDYSALTGGREELRKAWNNVDITSLANEIKNIR